MAQRLHLPGTLILLGLFLTPICTNGVWAQDDLLDLAQRKKQIAAQKLEGEVSQAMEQVRSLGKTNPQEARKILATFKVILEKDDVLSPERRNSYIRTIDLRLAELEVNLQKTITTPRPKIAAEDDLRNKYLANNPTARSNPSDIAGRYIKDTRDRISRYDRMQKNHGRGFDGVLRDVEKSAIPSAADFELPKNWAKLTESRKLFTGPRLSKEEVALLKAMNSVISVDFDRAQLQDVISYLSDRTGMTIVLDEQSLKETQVAYDTPVTMKAKKVTVRTVLRHIIGNLNLSYILKDGTVQVVTPQVARDTMITRSYPISDLLPPPDPRFGPFFNRARNLNQIGQIMQMIQTTIEPGSWSASGGRGTIWFHEPSNSIVVRNSAELHLSLASGIGR